MRFSDIWEDEKEVVTYLNDVEAKARGDYEISFVTQMIEKFNNYQLSTFITEKQYEFLEKIANRS